MRPLLLAATLALCGCQITIDPVADYYYYGLRATFTVSPNVLPDTAADPNDAYPPDPQQENDPDA